MEPEVEPQTKSCQSQTDIQSDEIVHREEYVKMKEEHEKLKREHEKLILEYDKVETELEAIWERQLLHTTKPFSEAEFWDNDDKVRFYTGLTNWETLSRLFEFLRPHILGLGHSSLDPFQQLMLALIRLRLGSSGIELGYQFKIHPSTVSRIFSDVIEMLYVCLKFLIVWPEREVLQKTLPMQFRKNYPKCVAIIDCFEIFIDGPNDQLARAVTYSSYKHHNTVKYLIAITPQGTVSFISQGWGGRASDKYITENANFLNNLLPGGRSWI